jgi:general secretion pathway protein G
VGVAVFGQLEKAKVHLDETQIKNISQALELYKLSFRNYPSTAEGLPALSSPKSGPPLMEGVPKDPWGNDYVYIYPGASGRGAFDILSYGPDGVQSADDVSNNKADATAQAK